MVKKRTRKQDTEPRPERASSTRPVAAPERPERKAVAVNLVALRPGLFVNQDQIVSVRVLPREEGDVYAILQLSNGDKLNLSRDEFTAITAEEPRPPPRLQQKS